MIFIIALVFTFIIKLRFPKEVSIATILDVTIMVKSRIMYIGIAGNIMVSKGPHPLQRFSIATAMCSQIAVAVAVDGLPTQAATDLFNLSQFILINIITYLYIIVN